MTRCYTAEVEEDEKEWVVLEKGHEWEGLQEEKWGGLEEEEEWKGFDD